MFFIDNYFLFTATLIGFYYCNIYFISYHIDIAFVNIYSIKPYDESYPFDSDNKRSICHVPKTHFDPKRTNST